MVKPKSSTNLAASYVMPGYEDFFHKKKGNHFLQNHNRDRYIWWFQTYGGINASDW